jgi:ferrous iron transport protein A
VEKKLSQMKYEEKGIIRRIDQSLKARIAGLGIREGKEITMMTKQPIKGPLVVTVDRAHSSIGLGLAEKIIVEVAE